MADNKTKGVPRDALRVDLNDENEVRYWIQHFGCSEGKLRAAVATVGPRVEEVQLELQRT